MEMKSMSKERISILVVDDIPQNLLAMTATLGTEEIEVRTAESGQEALELLLRHDVALAILDVQMPGMDGFALAELMRGSGRTRNIPIIFLTASGQDEQRNFAGYEAGAVDFLYKPVDARILRGKVEVFVELHRQRLALAQRMTEQERLLRLNSLMLSALSHDIRTPLAALTLNAEIFVRRSETPAIQQAGTRIKSVTAMLSRQVDHLVNLAQQPCDNLHPTLAWGDLAELVNDCLAVSHDNFTLSREGDAHCEFDAVLLSDAIDHLLLQAATYANGAPLEVVVNGDARRAVTIQTRFNTTLPTAAVNHLFGTGLALEGINTPRVGPGLHMAERIARAHGGSLIGRSRNGEGTLFELMLPRSTEMR